MKIVSIDVGIKNLAYIILETLDNKSFNIISWDSINLCGEADLCNYVMESKTKKVNAKNNNKNIKDYLKENKTKENITEPVKICNNKACYFKDNEFFCKTHAKCQTNYIIPSKTLSLQSIKALKLGDLHNLAKKYCISGIDEGAKKDKLLEAVLAGMKDKFLESTTTQSANDMDLVSVGIGIQNQFNKIPTMMEVDEIIIENQISPIANRMKTIQGMLAQYFIMNNKHKIKFISSANKLKKFMGGKKTSYGERKKVSVDIALGILGQSENMEVSCYVPILKNHKKKDDLADCFLQGLWYLDSKGLVNIDYSHNTKDTNITIDFN